MSDTVTFKIKRQDSETSASYWEMFTIPYIPNSNVISCLMDIQANPVNVKEKKFHLLYGHVTVWKKFVAPVQWS